ncbi:DedA family protein [Asanoa iriomotensis]|uniref:VTT domain-containing protein n=1 Tax=Asanoa iriomotensis TaxID=234613 RepID=A0ABQ4BYR8_9ACTN|nr:VTT domain-containing protein [Asanoa iriomotensis]GIF55663.1 hypothetical protein Air01nite_17580 [Asanoa iriomotensis]
MILNPTHLISTFGLLGILAVVFAESGILAGFFLPGDSLLFTTGLLVASGVLHAPLWLVCLLISVAAVAGDQVGYLFGRKVGPALFRRPDSRLFKQQNLRRAETFFANHGARSVVLARFVPIVRTFTPVVAGAGRMHYRTFVTYNVVGGIAWGTGVTVAGYFLGQIGFVRSNVELILVAIVAVSFVPVVVEFVRSRRRRRPATKAAERTDAVVRR